MMSDPSPDPPLLEPATRPVGGTEDSWCRAVPGGTGITVLALLLAKPPDLSLIRKVLLNLQKTHPILRSRIHFDPVNKTFSFVIPSSPHLEIAPFDLSATSRILHDDDGDGVDAARTTPFHGILEHEMNRNPWSDSGDADADVFHASLYHLSEDRWALALRLHTAACDRATAAALLRKLLLAAAAEAEEERNGEEEANLGIEELIPSGKANKPFWARGLDMLGYSLNSFRLANLQFVAAEPPRRSRMVRLKMNRQDTQKLVAGCESRQIKLCGALLAAALIAAHASKQPAAADNNKWEKYAVVTLIDCRPYLDPPLSVRQPGFYHSAILNTHDVCGSEKLWDLAKRTYAAFANAKSWNKHFTDMADLNFLMCRAIDNPGLTVSSSLRTAFVSVFEDAAVDGPSMPHEEIGVGDYVGCTSVHGVGPSVAIFDTIRDGELDCACVYPSPLHSREQMQKLVDDMKRILAGVD